MQSIIYEKYDDKIRTTYLQSSQEHLLRRRILSFL